MDDDLILYAIWGDAVNNIPFIHTMYTSAAVNVSGIVYTVNLEEHDVTGDVDIPVAYKPLPDNFTTSPVQIPASEGNGVTWSGSEYQKIARVTQGAEDLLGPVSNFPSADIYLFDVTESVAGGSSEATPAKWSWTSSGHAPEQYIMEVHVVNQGELLAYDSVNIKRAGESSKLDSFSFSSRYTGTNTLCIQDETTGSFANKLFRFPVEVTLYLPEWVEGDVDDNVIVDDGVDLTTEMEEFVAVEEDDVGEPAGSKKIVYTTHLADGENVAANVPVGTRYKIRQTEDSAAGLLYSQVINWNVGIL